MWRGFVTGNPGRGAMASILVLLGLPWVAYLGFVTLLFFSRVLVQFMQPYLGFFVLMAVWAGIAVVFDVAAGLWAWRNLTTRFRTLSSQRTKGKHPSDRPDRPASISAPPPVPAG
jgi:hypothetical protein